LRVFFKRKVETREGRVVGAASPVPDVHAAPILGPQCEVDQRRFATRMAGWASTSGLDEKLHLLPDGKVSEGFDTPLRDFP